MPLQPVAIPEDINAIPHLPEAEQMIDLAYDRIEAFMLADEENVITDNFVPCDFHLLDQTYTWIEENNLLTGPRFCELGSGLGMATLMASWRGMEAVGIEIDPILVENSKRLAGELDLPAKFYCGSFLPRGVSELRDLQIEVERVQTYEGDVYEEIGLGLNDFDLFFVYPWPGNLPYYEALFQATAATNALLLTYHGREGMRLARNVDE